MGIKESIANLRKALRTTQTNAPAVIDTLIRGLDGVETAAEEENTYSTDEKVVGKWIDGSDIYETVIDTGALPNAEQKSTNITALNIDKVISMSGRATNGTNTLVMPYTYMGTAETSKPEVVALYTRSVNKSLVIATNTDRSAFTESTVILRYTKASASRSPENDTKNNGDEEKNTDER